MRKRILISLFAAFVLSLLTSYTTETFEVKFSYSPENPQTGDEIKIKFKPDELSNLADVDKIDIVVYQYSDGIDNAKSIAMEKVGEGWIGKISASDTSYGLILKFESGNDKKKIAADFISENNYTFQVLLDDDDKVIESYKVSGIPTKFIVDKNGNIRFKSVGLSGTDEHLVNELSAMISLIN